MDQFMILIFGTGEGMSALPEAEQQAHMQKWFAWTEQLKAEGHYISGEALDSKSVTIGGKDTTQRDGYFSADKDVVVGGYYLINAESFEAAVEISKGCPTFELDGNIEVRPVMEL